MYANTRSKPVAEASSDSLASASSDASVSPSVVGGNKAPGARRLFAVDAAFGVVAPGNGCMAQGATPVTVEGGGSRGDFEEAPTFPDGVGMAEDVGVGVWAQGATPVTVTGG